MPKDKYLPVIGAGALVGLSIGYRWLMRDHKPCAKTIGAWFVVFAVLTLFAHTDIAQAFAWIIIIIVVLNDGYEIAEGIAT